MRRFTHISVSWDWEADNELVWTVKARVYPDGEVDDLTLHGRDAAGGKVVKSPADAGYGPEVEQRLCDEAARRAGEQEREAREYALERQWEEMREEEFVTPRRTK